MIEFFSTITRTINGQTYEEYRTEKAWGNVKPRAEAHFFQFETENEAKNFYNSLNTKVFNYFFKKTVVDIHPQIKFYIWLGDYSEPWTDERLCKFYGFSGYIDDNTAEPNSEWETILNA